MDKYRVLVVEDEQSISRFVKINLERNEFEVVIVDTGEEGLEMFKSIRPDAAVLDIMLPGINGMDVCSAIRELDKDVTLIMLTAKGQDMDKIMGLELGADDYMVKPFNPLELIARLRANLRKSAKPSTTESCGFSLNKNHHKIYKDGKALSFSPKEYELMRLFLENPLKTFSRNELLDSVWGNDYVGDYKTVDVHVRRLRAKIEEDAATPCYIETVWGHGYRWQGDTQ